MLACKTEDAAKAFAKERNAHYGFSAFPHPRGFTWYVGTLDELRKIGVVEPKQ